MRKQFLFLAAAAATSLCLQQVNAQTPKFVNGSPYWSLDGNSNASGKKLGTTNNQPLRIVTKNIERIRVSSSGYVGIGTTTPAYPLSVARGDGQAFIANFINTATGGDRTALVDIQNGDGVLWRYGVGGQGNGLGISSGQFYIERLGVGSLLNITQNGDVGIGTTAPIRKLQVTTTTLENGTPVAAIQNLSGNTFSDGLEIQAGTNTGSGSWYIVFKKPNDEIIGTISQLDEFSVAYNTTSDKRLKANIHETKYGLADLKKIQVRDYNFKGGKKVQTGFLAQQLYEVFPEAVAVGGDDPKTRPWMVDYGRITPLLVKAIQDQQEQIDQQQQQIEELKQLVSKLTNTQFNSITATNDVLLENNPNPVRESTTIKYSLPNGAKKAHLLLTDDSGRTIKTIQVNSSGIMNLDASLLSNGIYNYSLVVDGKTVQTKRLTVIK